MAVVKKAIQKVHKKRDVVVWLFSIKNLNSCVTVSDQAEVLF